MPQLSISIAELIFFLVAGVQILYWIYFLIGLIRIKRLPTPEKLPEVSVVVAAQNEIHNLRALIPALLRQKHPAYEIIIVNDRSDDGTLEFLVELEKKEELLKVLHIHDRPEHINGKKYALTLGIKAAKFENILLTDADCLPVSDKWVSAMANGFPDNKFVLGFSGYTQLKGFLNYFIRFETLLTGIQFIASAINGRPYMGVGRNMGYKKSLFLEKKGFLGFQEVIGGDDDLFVNKYATRRNTNVVVGADALVLSTPKLKWKSYLRQKHRHLSVGKHYRGSSKINLGLFNLSWILNLPLFVLALLLSTNLILVVSIAAGRLLILMVNFIVGTKRFGITFEWLGVILLDLIYPIYYIFAGTKAALVKTISWE